MFASVAFNRVSRAFRLFLIAGPLLAGCSGGGRVADQGLDHTGALQPMRPSSSAFTTTQPHQFPVHGIDVSKYQGDIDWDAVRAGGTRFAYIKATEGADHVDQKFRQNWEGARAAGVARGAYHFVFWCRSPAEEMANFKRMVPADPDALPPVLDVEATPDSKTCKRRLYREEAIRDMRAMLREMERHYGKKPVIYTTVDFYEAILNPNELADYPIWVRSTKHSPHVRYGERKWSFWQYQSDGRVPGVRGNVDRNAFAGTQQQWMAFAGGAAGSPQPVYASNASTLPALAPPALRAIPGSVAPTTIEGLIAAPAQPPASRALAARAPDDDDD